MLARQYDFGARHNRRERCAPAIGVKHGHHLQDHIALAEPEGVGHGKRQAVQIQGAMTVHHAFWISRGARGVAHTGRAVLVETRPLVRRAGSRGQHSLILIPFAAYDNELPDTRYAVANFFKDREKRRIDEDDAVVGMRDDVRQVVRR